MEDLGFLVLIVVVFGLMFAYVAWAKRFGRRDGDQERP